VRASTEVGINMTTIAVDAQRIYWNNEPAGASLGQIRAALKSGTGAATLASGIPDGPWAMELSGSTLAFVTAPRFGGTGSISTVPSTGGPATPVGIATTSSTTARVAIAGANIAWFSAENGGTIMAHTAMGNVALATNQGSVASIAAAADSVYWVHSAAGPAGALVRASWTGSAETIYTSIEGAGPIAVGPSAVFVVDNGAGVIKRIAR
jgi:hypothetical protein